MRRPRNQASGGRYRQKRGELEDSMGSVLPREDGPILVTKM